MKKKLVNALAAVCICANMFSFTSLAAPQITQDATVFDPEYYAATYPDVAAAFGNDPTLLYSHYKTNGKNEGRKPYRTYGMGKPTELEMVLDLNGTVLVYVNAESEMNIDGQQFIQGDASNPLYPIAANAIERLRASMYDPSSLIVKSVTIAPYSPYLRPAASALQSRYEDMAYAHLRYYGESTFASHPYAIAITYNGKNRLGAYAGTRTIMGFCSADGNSLYAKRYDEKPYTTYWFAEASLRQGSNQPYTFVYQ